MPILASKHNPYGISYEFEASLYLYPDPPDFWYLVRFFDSGVHSETFVVSFAGNSVDRIPLAPYDKKALINNVVSAIELFQGNVFAFRENTEATRKLHEAIALLHRATLGRLATGVDRISTPL